MFEFVEVIYKILLDTVHMCVCVLFVCLSVCLYVCMYVCVYTCLHMHTGSDVAVCTRLQGRLGQHYVHGTRRSRHQPTGLCCAIFTLLTTTTGKHSESTDLRQ